MTPSVFFSYAGHIDESMKRKLVLGFRAIVKKAVKGLDKQKRCTYILQEAIDNMMNYYRDHALLEQRQVEISCSTTGNGSGVELCFTNDMYRSDAVDLETKIARLNQNKTEENKALFNENMGKQETGRSGASLGLVSMILRSHNNLQCRIISNDGIFCTFKLTVNITP